MKTKNYNLKENIKKALRKAKKELKGSSWDWYANIMIYDNGAVTMNRDINGGTNEETIHKFGDIEGAELVESFRMRDHQEINVSEDAEYILGMLAGLRKQQEAEIAKSKYAGMSDDEIKKMVNDEIFNDISKELYQICIKNPDDASTVARLCEILGVTIEELKPAPLIP